MNVQTLYRLIAPGYAAIDPIWRDKFYPQAHQAFDRTMSEYLPNGGDILDLGCGVGANLARLLAMKRPFGSYTGVDLTPAMLLQSRKKFGALSGVRFIQLDLMADPLPEGPFNLILSTWVFEHLADPAVVIEKAREKLKPHGHIVLLFEARADAFLSHLLDWVLPIFSVRSVRGDIYRNFPGLVSEQHFSGPLGDLALLVLEKQENTNG